MEELIKIGTFIGFGGLIGAFVNHLLSQRATLKSKLYDVREGRYRNILAHMSVMLNPVNLKFMNHIDPATGKQMEEKDHFDFLNAEYYHACLYAPDPVLESLKTFIENPDENEFVKVAQRMRRDLWNKNSKLTIGQIKLANKALQRTSR